MGGNWFIVGGIAVILITSYQRPKLLFRLLKELDGEDVVVFDDCSDYNPAPYTNYCRYYRAQEHQGKKKFWKLWRDMFDCARKSNDNEFIFLQDDLYDIDLEGLRAVETPDKYVLNLMDVGPDRGWTNSGYVDCIFKTNRSSMEDIGWYIKPVKGLRFRMDPNLSSGVGQHLTQAFERNNIPMILPKQNYASHGNHESVMNPEERSRNPLIAQTGQ